VELTPVGVLAGQHGIHAAPADCAADKIPSEDRQVPQKCGISGISDPFGSTGGFARDFRRAMETDSPIWNDECGV